MKKIFLMLLLSAVAFAGYAEGKKQENPNFKAFEKRQEAYIISEALLSESQAETFMPIYREYKKSLFALGRQKFELKKNSRENFGAVLSQLAEIEAKEAQTKKEFYEKGANAITAEKMFRVLRAEERFYHNMIRGGHDRGKAPQHRGGRKGGAKPQTSPDAKGCPSPQGKGQPKSDRKPSQQPQRN